MFGDEYVGHPRLPTLMQLNSDRIDTRSILSFEESGETREFVLSKRNTQARTEGIARLLMLAATGELITREFPEFTKRKHMVRERPQEFLTTEDVPLSQNAQDLLRTLWAQNAVNSDHRLTLATLCTQAFGSNADENAMKKVMPELKQQELVGSKRGSGGGYWLTAKGCRRAKNLT